MGFFSIPMTPIAFAYSVELTYPVPEAMSNGMMIFPSKIYGAVLGLIAGILASYSPLYSVGLFIANCLICLVCSFFIDEDLRRLNNKSD